MVKKYFFSGFALIMCFSFTALNINAQTGGAAINASGAAPDQSAMLDVNSTVSGLLIPRMTMEERDAISSPATGLIIYNLDCNTINYNTGTPSTPNWVTLLNSGSSLAAGVSITSNPSGPICQGMSVTFTAIPGQSGLSPLFQWRINGVDIEGETGSTFVSSSLTEGDIVTCELTSEVPCVTGSPALSNAIVVSVSDAPAITGTVPGSVCGAGAVSLSASASAGSINWYANETGGAPLWTGSTFLTPNISSSTNFYVEANEGGCVSSERTEVTASVFQSAPAQPTITGQTVNLGGVNAVAYSAPISGATTYSWSAPVGSSIATGQGTSAITVDFSCSGSGDIAVVATNVCGSSPQNVLGVSTSLPLPGAISGPLTVTRNSTETYSIAAIPNATSYTWTVSSGTISSGQGSNSIQVNWGNSSEVGSVSVVHNSPCGTSNPQNVSVNVGYQAFMYTGSEQTFTVPSGITSVTLDAYGGQGDGNQGGQGGQAKGTLAVTSGQTLYVYVGGSGIWPSTGWNGGGNGWSDGGGASDVRVGGNSLGNRIIVAGGGGGGGYFGSSGSVGFGGNGGGNTGATGSTTSGGNGGGGGTQSSGGSLGTGGYASGTAGTLGQGGNGTNAGGGGGGYYGGGGGGWHSTNYGGGGGGGSNYLSPSLTNTTNNQGGRTGHGQVIVTW